jgi:hypothetical protein
MAFDHSNKDVRTYEHERQRRHKRVRHSSQTNPFHSLTRNKFQADRKKKYQSHRFPPDVERIGTSVVSAMQLEAIACIICENMGEGNADWAWEEAASWTPAHLADETHQVDLLLIAKPARRKRKGESPRSFSTSRTHVLTERLGATKDFVMIPSVPRVRLLEDAEYSDFDDFDDIYADDDVDWEVLSDAGHRSYAAVVRQ